MTRRFKPTEVEHTYKIKDYLTAAALSELLGENFEPGARIKGMAYSGVTFTISVATVTDA